MIKSKKVISSLLITVLLFIIGVFYFWAFNYNTGKDNVAYADGEYWYSASWIYRKPITITNSTGGALTNYQIQVTIPYVATMRSDFGDLRFTQANGSTEASYFIQSYAASSSAVVWIKVASVPVGASTIYMYYGNAAVTTTSNSQTTYDFYDNFSDGNYTSTPAWTVASGTFTASNGYMQSTQGSVGVNVSSTGLNIAGSVPYIFEYDMYASSTSCDGMELSMQNVSGQNMQGLYTDQCGFRYLNLRGNNVNAQGTYPIGAGAWYHVLTYYDGTKYVLNFNNGAATVNLTGSLWTTPVTKMQIGGWQSSAGNGYDNIIVRKYASITPTSSIGVQTAYSNGVCGSANGTTVASAPAASLCSTGSPSGVLGTGPWSWACYGNYGSHASCRAYITASTSTVATTTDGSYTVVKYTKANSTNTWVAPTGVVSATYLVVAGGGGGGDTVYGGGGGGGGGGVLTGTLSVTPGNSYSIAVGAGGPAGYSGANNGGNGGNSTFATVTATGGGGGGNYAVAGAAGGSGGGAGRDCTAAPGGTGTAGQGYAGGACGGAAGWSSAGGGGGAGQVGYAGMTPDSSNYSGTYSQGGAGIASSITGVSTYYAGGGGGSWVVGVTYPAGGVGGGGHGVSDSGGVAAGNGTDGLGGGGGGGRWGGLAGNGGSGVVIVRYLTLAAGSCGTANGGSFTYAPTTNLCSNGTASAVTGIGPWAWSCVAAGGTANCSASMSAYTSTAYTASNGGISCSVTNQACSGVTVFRMSEYRGGHAQLSSQSNYPFRVCCSGPGLSNLSSGAVALRISTNTGGGTNGTNAHTQTPNLNGASYTNYAYLSTTVGGVTCNYSNTASCASLGSKYVCLSALGGLNTSSPSGITSAHVAACDQSAVFTATGYLCCKAGVDDCTATVASDKSIFLGNTNIQLCSGTDTSASYATDPCYSACWKDSANNTQPVVGSANWTCSVCHDNSNNPTSCSTLAGSTYAWTMPGGYTSPANYTIISGTLTSANPVVKFTDSSSSRQLSLQVTSGNGPVCSASNSAKLLPIWKPVSPF